MQKPINYCKAAFDVAYLTPGITEYGDKRSGIIHDCTAAIVDLCGVWCGEQKIKPERRTGASTTSTSVLAWQQTRCRFAELLGPGRQTCSVMHMQKGARHKGQMIWTGSVGKERRRRASRSKFYSTQYMGGTGGRPHSGSRLPISERSPRTRRKGVVSEP